MSALTTCTSQNKQWEQCFFSKEWEQPKFQFHKWINKLWYMHTMEYYYTAIKGMKQ